MRSWQHIQNLFEQTLELEGDARSAFLHERAAGDADLIRRVEALLAADAEPLPDFDRTATDLLQELVQEPPAEELCGQSFGAYRIDEHLSTGGMGQVYRATRSAAGTERRVALKILRPGLDTEGFLDRFQRERETLAALEHEHIVSFVDASALPDGRPFLVMELVDGVPLTTWAQAGSVPRRARIELFLYIAAAVQYAHQKLVIHRDLKPSNVLVTKQGMPKLLDFGVASVLREEPDTTGHGPLTPSYASPEQRGGQALTTASDVYSLGVLLHELLTGGLPAPTGATGQGRDLDAILNKALMEKPAERYASVDRLADDLRRYLADETITARTPTWAERSARFLRRRRWSIATAVAVVAALALGWLGSDLGRRRARAESSLGWGAHREARVAARVFENWIATNTGSDADFADETASYLETVLNGEIDQLPESETLIRLALADIYLERGQLERGAEHAERAWQLAQTTRGVGERERERAELLRARIRGETLELPAK